MRKIIFRFAAALIFILTVNMQAAQSFSVVTEGSVPERLDVPYVPTPDDIVAEMIRMAGITEKDIVYDLGCGDGRIVIAACKKTGARGVGVDIDPDRIAECLVNAQGRRQGQIHPAGPFQNGFFRGYSPRPLPAAGTQCEASPQDIE